jgi:hypothetical protein
MAEYTHDDPFVEQQLAALTPSWTPNAMRARVRLDAAIGSRRVPIRLIVAGGVAAALAIAALTPQARTLAQSVWTQWRMTRVEVVSTPAPWPLAFRESVSSHWVRTLTAQADVEAIVGLALHLPSMEGLGTPNEFIVLDSATVEQVIDVSRLEAALQRVGAGDVTVPQAWDGTVIRGSARNIVSVRYPDGSTVVQSTTIPTLEVPAGVPLDQLATIVFRAAGLSEDAARAAGAAYAANPTWLVRLGTDGRERVERVSLRNGDAWVVSGLSKNIDVLRSDATRFYSVSSPTRERAIAMAEAIP